MFSWRILFFIINFTASIFFVIMCAVAVGESYVGAGSPFAFLGGVCFIWPALALALAEWFLCVRNVRRLERPLGVICGLVGALAIFAFLSNAGEACMKGESPGARFWLIFGAVCFGIAAYSLWCGWLRIRYRTCPDSSSQRPAPDDRPS